MIYLQTFIEPAEISAWQEKCAYKCIRIFCVNENPAEREVNPKRKIGKKALKEEASCATINTGGIYMAKKGQKFKKYTAEIKREVLEKYFSGKSTAKMLWCSWH